METNIDKNRFNRNFDKYMQNTEPQVDNWLYCKYLHEDIKTIIHNCLYHWDFEDPRLTFEDVEAELLMHLQNKKEQLRKYSGSWYNVLFTLFRRKLYDIVRSHRDQNKSLEKLWECKEYYRDAIEQLEHDTLQDPEPGQPIAVSTNDNELAPDKAIPASLSQSYIQTVSNHNRPENNTMTRHESIRREAYKVILSYAAKIAYSFNNCITESFKEEIREEERNDPNYMDYDLVIWCYQQERFVPNMAHIEREAIRNADEKLLKESN